MAEEGLRLICPRCDYVIGVVPETRGPKEPLICSNCGATVYPQNWWVRLGRWLRSLFRGQRTPRSR